MREQLSSANPDLLGSSEGEPTSVQIAEQLDVLHHKIEEKRHHRGFLGLIFGGEANARNNIVGSVVVTSIIGMVVVGWLNPDAPLIIEPLKAIALLAIGILVSNRSPE